MTQPAKKKELLAALPPPWPEDLTPMIRQTVAAYRRKLVVLDDDPTGTQTVHEVPVLTVWDTESLRAEMANDGSCFYILTNSRSLDAEAARNLNREIAVNLKAAAQAAHRDFAVVSRSDSTLRGHYPAETDVLDADLGPFDATLLIPYFEAGGRYTIADIHYVAEGEDLIPAAETPFARDPVFGYRRSNLRDWVEEKTGGRVKAAEVRSIPVERLRQGDSRHEPTRAVTVELLGLPRGSVCLVNACHPRDLEFFALGSLVAEQAGARFLYRTAAQFVAARLGLPPRPLLSGAELRGGGDVGGLIIAGSHVPKTTAQLVALGADALLASLELPVAALLQAQGDREIARVSAAVNEALRQGRDALVYTSRELVTASEASGSLAIGRRVSAALVEIVRRLAIRPRYLLAKGGITSSDIATHGLGIRRARVLGQLLPGVPVWETGPETVFPGLPYVVFPGNVGGPEALREARRILRHGLW